MEGPIDFVLLEFLDPIMPTPTIEVSGPDGDPVSGLEDTRLITDDVARVGFDPIDEAGQYLVEYSFVALDGAAQEGAHTFSVDPDDGLELDVGPLLAWIVGAVLVALLVVAVLSRRRPRS